MSWNDYVTPVVSRARGLRRPTALLVPKLCGGTKKDLDPLQAPAAAVIPTAVACRPLGNQQPFGVSPFSSHTMPRTRAKSSGILIGCNNHRKGLDSVALVATLPR